MAQADSTVSPLYMYGTGRQCSLITVHVWHRQTVQSHHCTCMAQADSTVSPLYMYGTGRQYSLTTVHVWHRQTVQSHHCTCMAQADSAVSPLYMYALYLNNPQVLESKLGNLIFPLQLRQISVYLSIILCYHHRVVGNRLLYTLGEKNCDVIYH